jgi:apolipoprotein N-acyltransferase
VEHHKTLYQSLGDWFAWISTGLLALVLARLFGLREVAH